MVGRDDLVPLASLGAGIVAAWVALGQLSTARRRHDAQTRADEQRRIIESLAKSFEQLGSDKLAVRVGAIHNLGRIAGESEADFLPIRDLLASFVHDRAKMAGSD